VNFGEGIDLVTMTANNFVFRSLLALVVLAPLPLGSNRPAAWSLLALAVAVILVGWALTVGIGRARAPVPLRRLWPVAVPFAIALLWAWVQTLAVVPTDWQHPLWAEAAHGLPGAKPAGAITLDVELTRTAIMRLLSYAGIFWLAVQLGRERSRAREGLIVVATAGILYAAYGLAVHLDGAETILWWDKWAYRGDLTATFVNRNSYGTYAGIGLLCCLGLFVNGLRHLWGAKLGLRDHAESVLVGSLPYLIGGGVVATALLLSHSRGAFLSTGVAMLGLMVVLAAGRVVPVIRAAQLAVVVLAMALLVTATSGDMTFQRLAMDGLTDEVRGSIYRLTETAIGDAPWTGFGLGAFEPAFRLYRDTSLPLPYVIDFAHNVHLELIMDLGLPGAAALYAALAVIMVVCLRGLIVRRRDQIYPAVGLAVTLLVGLHGFLDFSLQMPAIAATYALLLGIAYAQSFNTVEHRPRP
jgi:hypothetical protein